MPPPYSKVASPSNAKFASESSNKADVIRKSWAQQTSCDKTSAEQLPQLAKTNSKTFQNTPNTDVNRNHRLQKEFEAADQATSSSNTPSLSSSVSVPLGQNRKSLKKRKVVSKPPDSLPPHAKTDLFYSYVGTPKPRVSLERALASAEKCPVMDMKGLRRLLRSKSEDASTSGDMLQRFQKRMEVVKQIGVRGVVHSVGSEVKWIVLGEEEEQKWYGGVGSRTRQATRKIISWMGEGEDLPGETYSEDAKMEEKQATAGTKNSSHDNIDCDLSFNEEDWYVKKEEKPSSREEGGNSDEDWYRKPKPSSSMASADSSYFNTIGKMTRSTLNNLVTLGNLTITAVAGNATVNDEETVEDEVEEVGTCPMCQEEMEMKVLIDHAGDCQG